MNSRPRNPEVDAVARAARAAFEARDARAAEALCRRALVLDGNRTDVLELLGVMQLTQNRNGEAIATLDHLCRLDPKESNHWMNLGTAYRGTGQFDEALLAFRRASALGENRADFFFNVGLVHMGRSDLESARAVLSKALQLAPHDDEIRWRYVQSCFDSIQYEEALAALEHWQPPPDTRPEVIAGIAQVMMNLGEYQRVEAILADINRDQHNPHSSLIEAHILERTNRLAEAEVLLQKIERSPDAPALGTELMLARAKVAQRHGQHALALELYRQGMVDCKDFHERHFVQFSCAQSLHQLGRREETLKTLREAHQSQIAHIQLQRPLTAMRGVPQMAITEWGCSAEDVSAWQHQGAPSAQESPVFVVAFPRSGTTLLELTLDAHPLLRSMDEQPFIQNALDDLIAAGATYPEKMAQLTAAQLERVRDNYWGRVAKKVQLAAGQRIVDKNPLNILRLPVIKRIFPNAPILLAIRHPCDVILSCYMQHFRAPEFALLCADLPSLARGYRKTFDFWYQQAALLQPKVIEVRYESLVSEFEGQVRRIAEALTLPWNDAMLDPAQRAHAKRYISTPSYSQVVEPVSRKAVGRWQQYHDLFEPLLPLIEPYLRRWGYDS